LGAELRDVLCLAPQLVRRRLRCEGRRLRLY
jgi:hypothetical protein